MGIFDFFGGGKPTPKSIAKQKKRAKERYAQTDYREMAMEKLLEWGTPESLDAVLERFNAVAQSPYYDEQEKNWLSEKIAEQGEPGEKALVRFLGKSNEVAHAISALRHMCSESDFHQHLVGALEKRLPEDYRSLQAKKELIKPLLETLTAENIDVLLPYLDDHSDDVQCAVIDAILSAEATQHYPEILALIYDDSRSGRVSRHAASAIATMGISVDPKKALLPEVAEDFTVRDGKLKSVR